MKNYKIALAQINPVLGNLEYNKMLILKIIKSTAKKADLIVFPELSLVGYPPEDLILRKTLLDEVERHLKDIRECAKKSKI